MLDIKKYCLFLAALLFGGKINPAHPKHIGSIDPSCNVVGVIRGKSREEQEFWKLAWTESESQYASWNKNLN